MRVGVDLDGVGYDFVDSVRTWLLRCLPKNHPGRSELGRMGYRDNETTWDFYENWNLSLDEFLFLCALGVDAEHVFRVGVPHEGFVEGLHLLRDSGHTVSIVTDRSLGALSRESTLGWLNEWAIPYDDLIFTEDKTSVKADIFIEDRGRNYYALHNAGTLCYLLDRPWNRHVDAGEFRVFSFREFVGKVQL